MILYRLLLGIAGSVAAIVIFFFAWGVSDGTVSADNIVLWLMILGVVAAVLWGALSLKARGQTLAASLVLLVLALPGGFAGLFILAALILQPRWN
ncbi:MAG TPA: osmoprotectant transporter permease [Allosphingosinicella sp.]|jgi:Na+/melibiose symporter-like transporter|nr:osmoprotectant transporter permease [Allosphingosinicella sp.]